jgi:nicotinate-nucleotide adenylyltransferase
MVAAATAPYKPRLVASEIELTRVGTSFTFETVAQVRESVGPSVELFWIIGRDNIAEIPRWKSPRRIVQAATIVAGGRPGTTVPERIPLWLAGKLIILDGPNLAVSSTELRDQAAQGILDPEWIPESVRAIIMREGLYGYPHTTLPKN